MAAEGDNDFMRYIYRGEEGEIIPREATHIIVGEDVTFVRARAFRGHTNIVDVICHENVKKIGESTFQACFSLRRVIMPGVKVVEQNAFFSCPALTDVECGMLEIIGHRAFQFGRSLRNINLPSARIVGVYAFNYCINLTDAKFGSKLERIDGLVFVDCPSLEQITIPLKYDLITRDNIFQGCIALKHVDLVEEAELHETIAALQLEQWRNDMNDEIDSINKILPVARVGTLRDDGEKAQAIRTWVRSVLDKIIHYKGEHQRILDVAENTLQPHLPKDILTNNVLPFLSLPSYSFGGEI